MVLEYMEGGELDAQVGQKTKFTEGQVRYFLSNHNKVVHEDHH